MKRFAAGLVVLGLLGTTATQAQQAAGSSSSAPLSVEEFVRLPAFGAPLVSRNGRYLAATIPINDRLNLGVVDLETRKGAGLTNIGECDVVPVSWVGNDRILFTLQQTNSPTGPGQFDCGGLFMIHREGKESRVLSPTIKQTRNSNQRVYRGYTFLRTIPNNDEEIIAAGRIRDAESVDVYRLNIATGRSVLLTTDRPTRTVRWVLDRNRVPRVTTSWIKDTNTYIVHYRKDESSPWQEIARYDDTKPGQFTPLYFESDNQTLHVAMDGDGMAATAVYRYDPNNRKRLDLVVENKRFDMERTILDPNTDELRGYYVEGDKPQIVWLNERDRRLQKLLDDALTGEFNGFTPIRGDLYLVSSRSDRNPSTWYLFDDGKKTLEELFSSRPWLKGRLVEQRPFTLKTRDGLEIPSYYFLPRNYKPGDKLPTVVHIHGGPSVRADFWGQLTFGVVEAQVLASRGYAVVLPNFRITPGLGSKIFYSGFGTYGRQMLEDHEDAAKWAVAQGFADPDRICISGASYGGYATLMSLARFPSTFKCGVAGLVVSDMPLQLTSPSGDTAYSPAAVEFWKSVVGVKEISEIPKEISPVNLADRIKQPIMFYAGADDIRTPIEQTRSMVRALERSGNKPRAVLIMPEEGHGFGKKENNIKLYEQMIKFLDDTIGAGAKRPG